MTLTEFSQASPWLATDWSVYTKGISWPRLLQWACRNWFICTSSEPQGLLNSFYSRALWQGKFIPWPCSPSSLLDPPGTWSFSPPSPMLIPPCSELLGRERPGENGLKIKQNNQIKCFLLVYTAGSVGPAVGGSASQGRTGIPRTGRARSA